LGSVKDEAFCDLKTSTLYFDIYKLPWDLQKTAFSYMKAMDNLTGSSLKNKFLEAFDEDGNGIVTYDEFGQKGLCATLIWIMGDTLARMSTEKLGYLKGRFSRALTARISEPSMNADGHDIFHEMMYGAPIVAALAMSQMDQEMDDPFQPGLKWGKGKWPSFQFAKYFQRGVMIYGRGFPNAVEYPSLYTAALYYADLTQNGGQYVGEIRNLPDTEGPGKYISDVLSGKVQPLDFTFYVPNGFDALSGSPVPNVEVTQDPAKILTASFAGGKEVWPEVQF
jgi:hypothetical protein